MRRAPGGGTVCVEKQVSPRKKGEHGVRINPCLWVFTVDCFYFPLPSVVRINPELEMYIGPVIFSVVLYGLDKLEASSLCWIVCIFY